MHLCLRLSALLLTAATLHAQSIVGTGDLNPSPADSPIWTIGGDLSVGNTGTGSLVITGGGRVNANRWVYIGHQAGSAGSVTISGTGSLLQSETTHLVIGNEGSGSVVVADGGELYSRFSINIGEFHTGEATVNGATFWSPAIRVGVRANASLTLNSGRAIADVFLIGSQTSGNGAVTVNSGTLAANSYLEIGREGTGSLTISGGEVSAKDFAWIGTFGAASGTISMSSGTFKITNGFMSLGNSGRGQMTVTGGTVNLAGEFRVGDGGTGTLAISDGEIRSSLGNIGRSAGSSGTVTMSGGTWTNDSLFVVGNAGNGSFTLTGGTVSNVDGEIGRQNGIGRAVVSGGAWTNSGTLYIGKGTDSLAFLRLSGTGTVNVDSGVVRIAHDVGSRGQLNFGSENLAAPTTSGTLNADDLVFGSGAGSIQFNQTDTLTLSAKISGNGTVVQRGVGTTILTGTNTYTGPTTVQDGTLLVDGSIASDVVVKNGATFGGDGIVAGAITLESGSTLTPVDCFDANSLTWEADATMIFHLGDGESDILELAGALTKSGSGAFAFEFRNANWQFGQTYVLIDFDSTNFVAQDFTFTNTGGFGGEFAVDGTTLTFQMTTIPEPSTYALALAGLLGIALMVCRKASVKN